MSTTSTLTPEAEAELVAYVKACDRVSAYDARHPRETAVRFKHQQAVWDLLVNMRDPLTGGRLEHRPEEVVLVAPNQCGKTEAGGQVVGEIANRAKGGGWIWTGAETLSVSTSTLEEKLGTYIAPHEVARWTNRNNDNGESVITLKSGTRVRCKSYDQGRKRWQGQSIRAAWIDEQPPDEIVSELRVRCVRYGAPILYTFTPLGGVQSVIYDDFYAPYQEHMDRHGRALGEVCHVCGWQERGPHAVEVSPGRWVVTARMRDNTFLDPRSVDSKERAALASGRVLEARVRYHGEWLDISEDRIIPVEEWDTWEVEPPGGWVDTVAWIDPAYSLRATQGKANCRSSIAVASTDHHGRVYLRESRGGHWTADEREAACIETLREFDFPNCYVQRVGGDIEFGRALNGALMRAGARACVTPWPDKGMVPDKITRANSFAPMVSSGQFKARPEHVEVRRQAALLSADYLRSGGICDDIDAAMGAALKLVDQQGHPEWRRVVDSLDGTGYTGDAGSQGMGENANDWTDHEGSPEWAFDGDLSADGWVD